MKTKTLYSKRNTEDLGDLYLRHVEAMTSEELHSKADIAAELAWRDALIELATKVCKALPDFDIENPDAADFKDHSEEFMRAMVLSRSFLQRMKGS